MPSRKIAILLVVFASTILGALFLIKSAPIYGIYSQLQLLVAYFSSPNLVIVDRSQNNINRSKQELMHLVTNYLTEKNESFKKRTLIEVTVTDELQQTPFTWADGVLQGEFFSFTRKVSNEFGVRKISLTLHFDLELMKRAGWSDEAINLFANSYAIQYILDAKELNPELNAEVMGVLNEGAQLMSISR